MSTNSFETSDGKFQTEKDRLKNDGSEDEAISVVGDYASNHKALIGHKMKRNSF